MVEPASDILPCLQAYELVQGPLVRWSEQQAGQRPPPTAVMVHGILGSRKNMQAYAHRLVEVHILFPLPTTYTLATCISVLAITELGQQLQVGHVCCTSLTQLYGSNSLTTGQESSAELCPYLFQLWLPLPAATMLLSLQRWHAVI